VKEKDIRVWGLLWGWGDECRATRAGESTGASGASSNSATVASSRERVLYRQHSDPNQLNHRDDFGRPALRHGSLNSLFQVA